MGERDTRQSKMLEIIRENHGATVTQLREQFGVSLVTIRKDLEELEREGFILRKFGGAVPSQSKDPQEPFNVRSHLYHRQKQLIGDLAASMIYPMESVMIDSGSTALEIVRNLRRNMPATIITPALNVALAASDLPNVTVILPGGGLVDRFTLSLEGSETEESFARLHADKVFLGVRGVDLIHGLTDTDARRIRLKQILIRAAQRVIVVADSSKFGKPSLIDIAPLDAVHEIITDEGVDPDFVCELEKRGIQVHIAKA